MDQHAFEARQNLAPLFFFVVASRKSPILSISSQHRSDGFSVKDTYVNIHETGEFVASLVTLPFADGMRKTAFEHPPEVDEFEAASIEKAPSIAARPPRVAHAPTAMECKLYREATVGDFDDHVVWGRVVRFHLLNAYSTTQTHMSTLPRQPRLAGSQQSTRSLGTYLCPPLDSRTLLQHERSRMHRPDVRPANWAVVNQDNWSPSGSVLKGENTASPGSTGLHSASGREHDSNA